MRYLKTSEAAALLNVSPNTLRAWERRFGFPKPQRSPGKHRLFTHGEVAALRDALQEGLSISSAISRAREGLAAEIDSPSWRASLNAATSPWVKAYAYRESAAVSGNPNLRSHALSVLGLTFRSAARLGSS